MQVKRISHAAFVTPDVERMVEYYTTVLGLQSVSRENGRAFLATKSGLLAVVLEHGDAASCKAVAFQVAPDTDLDALRRALAADGVASDLRSDAAPGIGRSLVFDDPKGTRMEVFARSELLPEDPVQTTLTPLKLGHLAFNVLDVKAITDFYVRHLGFRVSDWRGDVFVFLRCGPDHHTINFTLSHSNTVKLHHVAFELKDWAEMGRALDHLGKHDTRMIWGPGRHLIGHNIFTYHHNPDGQIIELYTELDQIKDEDFGYFEPRAWHQDHPQRPKIWPMNTMSNYWGAGPPAGFGD